MNIDLCTVGDFVYYRVDYTKIELEDTFLKAIELCHSLNPRDPSGRVRTKKEHLTKNFGGLISEKLVSDLLQIKVNSSHLSCNIIGSTWGAIGSGDYQIDHVVKIADKQIKIETRSSFSYRTISPDRVISGAFSIIGPYSTKQKQSESVKDFYAFSFFFFPPDQLLEKYNSGLIPVYFAGGASREMLFDPRISSVTNLKMGGASYRVIKPISNGLSAPLFIEQIFRT